MASKSKQRRRVLGASCILAALIVAGSSFAWFTAKDEVVNKLSAENKYNVVITENFTPKDQWTPGQEVTKEAGVVNTGNINAIVSTELSSQIKLVKSGTSTDAPGTDDSKYVALSDDEATAMTAGGKKIWDPEGDGLVVYQRAEAEDGAEETRYGAYYEKGEKKYKVTDVTVTKDADGVVTNATFKFVVMKDETTIDDSSFTYSLKTVGAKNYLVATAGDISVNIELANESDWTKLGTSKKVFGYNKILGAGDKTSDFIKSVTLDKDTELGDYVSFDYALKITSKSAQAVDTGDVAAAYIATYPGYTPSVSGTTVSWS